MIYTEFKRHLGKAGITVDGFASLLGVRPNSVSNHAKRSAVPVSYAVMAVLLGDAADRGIDCPKLLARYGIRQAKKPEGNLASIENYRERKSKLDKT